MPLVSVIIPIYNAQTCLPDCLNSVLSQSFKDIQVILINDGSKDDSLAMCRKFALADSRILVIDQKNSGPGAARNAGLNAAKGKYLQFLDSDDRLQDDAIQTLVDAIDGHDLAIAHFLLCIKGKSSQRGLVKDDISLGQAAFLGLLIKWPGSYFYSALWNKLYAREIVEKHHLRFDETFIWGEDCLFNMRYYHYVKKMRYVPKAVYCYSRKVSGLSWGSVFQLHKGIRIKYTIYRSLRSLYRQAGLYRRYYWRVQRYLLNITLMD